MGSIRGLRGRLCPNCSKITPHRTLYAKTESGGRTRWFQLFWACTRCGSLNHILLPCYTLERASSPLPSALAMGVVNALGEGPLDFELVATLRRRQIPGIRHVFNSEVAMALEYLKGRGVTTEESSDRTERVLETLRAKSTESRRLGLCPAELNQGIERRALVSLYAQGWSSAARGMRLVSIGVLCLHCQYHQIDLK